MEFYYLFYLRVQLYHSFYSLAKTQDGHHEDEDEVETVRGYSAWKSVILLYEFAQGLSLFHTIMFFGFWYQDLFHYYYYEKEPRTYSNRVMRVVGDAH